MSRLYQDHGPSVSGRKGLQAGPSASGQKVLLATTAYDSPDASNAFSIARSREALSKAGIPTAYLLLSGNCHVDDARNTVVKYFLESDCTELVFLDADVSWEPHHLVELCSYDVDIVGGVYPYRRENEGTEKMPVRMLPDVFEPGPDGLLEVSGLPTGFLRIKRHVFEQMAAQAIHFGKDGKNIPLIFERDIHNEGRRSGDIRFCMKWQEMGGKLYAAANLRLGHCGKVVLKDSLAASLRRQKGNTLAYVAGLIRERKETTDAIWEAAKAVDNKFGMPIDPLRTIVGLARAAKGPILEMGSGLSTVLMAAATEQTVWCVEHDSRYAASLKHMVRETKVENIALVTCPIKGGWYALADDMMDMPDRFALAVVDGPPRRYSDRMEFFEVFGNCCDIIFVDDADDADYAAKFTAWAEANNRDVTTDGRGAVILKP